MFYIATTTTIIITIITNNYFLLCNQKNVCALQLSKSKTLKIKLMENG